jgi:hypothetical protein
LLKFQVHYRDQQKLIRIKKEKEKEKPIKEHYISLTAIQAGPIHVLKKIFETEEVSEKAVNKASCSGLI